MARGNKPGFFDTFREGWKPPAKRSASMPTEVSGAPAGATAPAGAAKPKRAARGAAKGARNGGGAKRPAKASPALVKRKDELAKQFAELQWDLGGITYEMARREHFRLEVLNAQAAKLQQVDAELGQIERLLKLDEAGAAGACPHCGALQARGAAFCWQCGKEVTVPTSPEAAAPKPAAKKQASTSGSGSAKAPKTKPIKQRRSRTKGS